MCGGTFRYLGRQSSHGKLIATNRRKFKTRIRTASLLGLAAYAGACAATHGTEPQAAPRPTSALTLSHEQTRRQLERQGQVVETKLRVTLRTLSLIGRTARINVRVTNTYEETINGILYRVRLISTDGTRVLTTEYDESDAEVQPGRDTASSIELQSMYFATVPRFLVEAIPIRIGGKAFAVPAAW